MQSVLEAELVADDELEAMLAGRETRAHNARDGALVGDGQCRITEFGGTLDEFLGVRCAAQEAEVGEAVQLGVTHGPDSAEHAVQEPASMRRSRKIQTRTRPACTPRSSRVARRDHPTSPTRPGPSSSSAPW